MDQLTFTLSEDAAERLVDLLEEYDEYDDILGAILNGIPIKVEVPKGNFVLPYMIDLPSMGYTHGGEPLHECTEWLEMIARDLGWVRLTYSGWGCKNNDTPIFWKTVDEEAFPREGGFWHPATGFWSRDLNLACGWHEAFMAGITDKLVGEARGGVPVDAVFAFGPKPSPKRITASVV